MNIKSFPELLPSDVHIWTVALQQPEVRIQQLSQVLAVEEHERAARFLVNIPRNNFIVARATLRNLLARYLHCQPQDLVFQQNQHGKLYLENSSLEFNLSHSHELALFAFTLNRPVGVDLEFMREKLYAEDIARRFFAPAEVNALLALPKEMRKQAFFNCWSRKEAFIKAVGVGIFYPLDQFEVAVDCANSGEKSLHIHSAVERAKNWKLHALNVAPDYAAAVVTQGEIINLSMEPSLDLHQFTSN